MFFPRVSLVAAAPESGLFNNLVVSLFLKISEVTKYPYIDEHPFGAFSAGFYCSGMFNLKFVLPPL